MLKKLITSTALVALFTCSSPAFSTEAKGTIIAKVNGQALYLKDLEKIEKTLPPELVKNAKEKDKKRFFEELRNQLIDITVLTETAKKAGLEKDPEVQKALEQAKEQMIVQAYIGKELTPLVNDKSIKEKYDEFIKKFPKDEMETKARHIMVASENEAKALIDQLKGGADFQKLARDKSTDKVTAAEGGDLGYMRKSDVDPAFGEALFSLKPGSYGDKAVKTAMGWHIIKVEDRRRLKPPKFDEIKKQLGSVVFQEQLKKLVERQRDKASVERFDADGKPEMPSQAGDEGKGSSTPPAEEKK